MKMEFSAGGIIFRRQNGQIEFALILDSYDQWTFPKGHIEKGEKPEIAARREVGEEIGIKDLKITILLDKIDYWFKFKEELFHKYVYFYLMEAPGAAELKPQVSEIKEARWVIPKEALAILGYKKDSGPLLQKAFEQLEIVL